MKKCSYCGKEYPDNATRCSVDEQPLLDPTAPPPLPSIIGPPSAPPITAPPAPQVWWTSRRLRIFELLLVCTIAFARSLLASTWYFFSSLDESPTRGTLAYSSSILQEATTLALVWYILMRRSRSFAALGMRWTWPDFGWSFPLYAVARFALYVVYYGIYFSGIQSLGPKHTNDSVGHFLFGGGMSTAIFIFQFLNPFFEELIVRAYLMTEIRELTGSVFKAIVISTAPQTSYHIYQGAPAAHSDGASFLIFSL